VDADGFEGAGNGRPDHARLVTQRLEEYVELWEDAAAKLRDSSYRSEDLLDDWFRLWGKAVRDMTAGAALLWGAGAGGAPRAGANRDHGRTPRAEEQ
jgi:hypothetical protein